jgi:hypothetical protein
MGFLFKAFILLAYAIAAFFLVVREFKKSSPVHGAVVGSL